jgi:hypothetical protein
MSLCSTTLRLMGEWHNGAAVLGWWQMFGFTSSSLISVTHYIGRWVDS